MNLNEVDVKSVAKYVAQHCSFRGQNYEKFAEKVLELVKKYGVSNIDGGADYDLSSAIYKQDAEASEYFGGSIDLGRLLFGGSDLTEEQKQNRIKIKGGYNENI